MIEVSVSGATRMVQVKHEDVSQNISAYSLYQHTIKDKKYNEVIWTQKLEFVKQY